MSDVLIEKNLNKARSLLINGKLIEGSNLLNSIINYIPIQPHILFLLKEIQKH